MTRIILIGAGRVGRALVELFHHDPSVERGVLHDWKNGCDPVGEADAAGDPPA